MKDEMMAKIMDEVMKKMGGTEAPAQSMRSSSGNQ